eukprot:c9010_g1_i1.p1 GENE.c9010_g1_i1~~c9010_g1_i1.p1  ORF type:complete len:709 (+),score=178.54 c9010_g1_i1:1-2127(+)
MGRNSVRMRSKGTCFLLFLLAPLVCVLAGLDVEPQELQVNRTLAWESAFTPKPVDDPKLTQLTVPRKRHYWGFHRLTETNTLIQLGGDETLAAPEAADLKSDQIDDSRYCHETRIAKTQGSVVRFCYYQGTTTAVTVPSAFTNIRPQLFASFEPVSKLQATQSELAMSVPTTITTPTSQPNQDPAQTNASPKGTPLVPEKATQATPSLSTAEFSGALKSFKPPSSEALKALGLDMQAQLPPLHLDNPSDYIQQKPSVLVEDENLRVKVEQLERKLKELESSISSQPQVQPQQHQQQTQQQTQQQPVHTNLSVQEQTQPQLAQPYQDKVENIKTQAQSQIDKMGNGDEPNESFDKMRVQQKLREAIAAADAQAALVNPVQLGLMDPHPTSLDTPKEIKSAVNNDFVRVDAVPASEPQSPTSDDMPLVADMDFFPSNLRHHSKSHPSWKMSKLLWDFGSNENAKQLNPTPVATSPTTPTDTTTGTAATPDAVTVPATPVEQPKSDAKPAPRSFMDEQVLVQTHHALKPFHIFSSLMDVTQLVSAFTFSTNMLELTADVVEAPQMPTVAGVATGAFHTPSAFGWRASDAAQGYALDVPDDFNHVRISGSFSLAEAPVASAPTTTIEWVVMSKHARGIDVHATGSFDIEAGEINLARQAQFYRRVSTGVVPITVGQDEVHVDKCEGAILMVWMKPSQPCSLLVNDNLKFTFT